MTSFRTRRSGRATTGMATRHSKEWRRRVPGPGAAEWNRYGEPGFENIDISDLLGSFGGGAPGDEAGGHSIFEDLMGRVRGGRTSRPRAGRTMEANLTIPFLTAVSGGETTIEVQHGSGKRESLVVKIPPGIDTGAKLRLKGQGEPGPKGAPRRRSDHHHRRRAAPVLQTRGAKPPGRGSDHHRAKPSWEPRSMSRLSMA